jgi:hypothetical protein
VTNPSLRSSIVGLSQIGGICSQNKYSIVEYLGFNEIQNAAHELGHKFVNINELGKRKTIF